MRKFEGALRKSPWIFNEGLQLLIHYGIPINDSGLWDPSRRDILDKQLSALCGEDVFKRKNHDRLSSNSITGNKI